ncbi:MAG: transglycosylase SLT domain-containing protein [Kofleriaceae bacterium]
MRRLLVGVCAVCASLGAAIAEASPATDLGAAYKAYDANDLDGAHAALAKLDIDKLIAKDYALWLRGMVALRSGDAATADAAFRDLGQLGGRLAREVPWRRADVLWSRGDRASAAKAYAKLIATDNASDQGDVGTAKFRIAEVATGSARTAAFRRLVLEHPAHPLAAEAMKRAGGPLTIAERIARAKQLQAAHLWDEAVVELQQLPAKLTKEQARQRDYWLGTTLFKMRRRYAEAGTLLLGVYKKMGADAASAMFHGARALSRADKDDEAIVWYEKVVAQYPRSSYAEEAAFLAGWLEFNRGNYGKAIGPLERSLAKYGKSKWVDDALWYLGLSHYFLGEWAKAKERLSSLAKRGGSLEGGKGKYWLARMDERLDEKPSAIAGYTDTIKRYPFSWYALLSHARLARLGVTLPPFGVANPTPRGPDLAATVDESLARDPLIRKADELLAAGMGTDAGIELARDERGFLKRNPRGAAFAMLLDRYRKAGNFNRPWMLAISYNGGALDGPPDEDARRWWEHAYPRAYRELIEKHQHLGKNPEGYLYSIMRKESGFDPHVLSYADAQGLLQMIPATTRRVAKELGIPYDAGSLYEPDYNVKTGSWYIGHVLNKFKLQVPLGSGSFNSGPRPVMRWIDKWGDREIDELVELVPYTQTREYMKKVTENFARYQYLYENKVYVQPLAVDKAYLDDRITY